MPQSCRQTKAILSTAPLPPTNVEVVERPRRTRHNGRYQAAIHQITHEDDDGITRSSQDNTFVPDNPTAPQQQLQRRRAAPGTAAPMKATEARIRRERECKRGQRLARNEREDAADQILVLNQGFNGMGLTHSTIEPPNITSSFPDSPSHPTAGAPRDATTPNIPRPNVSRTHSVQRSNPHRLHSTSVFGIPLKKKAMSTAQDVWFFFHKPDKQKREMTVWCRLCKRSGNGTYAASTSTGVLRNHLTRTHPGEYLDACRQNGWKPKGSVLEFNSSSDGKDINIIPRFPYTITRFCTMLVEWIVGFDESINVVECQLFQQLLLLMRDTLQDKDIPHRSTVRRLISSVYKKHFTTLIQDLKASEGKLSLTVDGWDDHSMRAFIGVTVHYLRRMYSGNARGVLQLQSGLIVFLPIPGRHTGQVLAKALLRVTDRAEITGRVRCITTDGAANMGAMLEDYESLLKDCCKTLN